MIGPECVRGYEGDILPWPITMEEPGWDEGLPRGGDELCHRLSLRPFGALGDVKLDLVAFSQGLEARGVNR